MEHATRITLREGVLNDDTMLVADEGYHFGSDNNKKVLVDYYTYATEWSNHRHYFYADSVENALKHYEEICGKLTEEERDSIDACVSCICQ